MTTAYCRYCRKPIRSTTTRCPYCHRVSPIATTNQTRMPRNNGGNAIPKGSDGLGASKSTNPAGFQAGSANDGLQQPRPSKQPHQHYIQAQCPHCACSVRLVARGKGFRVSCPTCRVVFQVAAQNSSTATTQPSPQVLSVEEQLSQLQCQNELQQVDQEWQARQQAYTVWLGLPVGDSNLAVFRPHNIGEDGSCLGRGIISLVIIAFVISVFNGASVDVEAISVFVCVLLLGYGFIFTGDKHRREADSYANRRRAILAKHDKSGDGQDQSGKGTLNGAAKIGQTSRRPLRNLRRQQ
jgi:hypothetical protein